MLVELEREFLRKHDVTKWNRSFRCEAQQLEAPAVPIKSLDVHQRAAEDAVASSRVAADDLEMACGKVLRPLQGRECRNQQALCAVVRIKTPRARAVVECEVAISNRPNDFAKRTHKFGHGQVFLPQSASARLNLV